jgi:hypothetical protein
MADEPVVVMAEPLESASDRDAANYRDASMRQLEMFLDKAKRLARKREARDRNSASPHTFACSVFTLLLDGKTN